jgi:hypothetical protein
VLKMPMVFSTKTIGTGQSNEPPRAPPRGFDAEFNAGWIEAHA